MFIQLVFPTVLLILDVQLVKCRRISHRYRYSPPCYRYPCHPLPQRLSTVKPFVSTNSPFVPTRKPFVPPTTTNNRPEICNQLRGAKGDNREAGNVVCRQLTEEELMKQLKDVGGYNPRLVAMKEKDTCGFKDLTADYMAEEIPTNEIPTGFPARRYNSWRKRRYYDEEDDSNIHKRSKRAAPEVGTKIRGCWGKGSKSDLNLYHLCSECPATTTLAQDRFPRFINEVVCRKNDQNAWKDLGRCVQRVLKLDFLQSTNRYEKDERESAKQGKEVYKRVWEEYTQIIRTCCECQIYPAVFNSIP